MEFAMCATQELAVSSGSSFDDKERVREAIDIVDLIGSHMQLRRKGRIYVGLCPWHDDTRPSMQVNPERQSFKCWVCDIGGDVFSFVMKMEGVDFREALQMLADRAGITLTPFRPSGGGPPVEGGPIEGGLVEGGPPAPVSGERKRTLYRAMAWVEKQYHRCLLDSPEAEPARRYLEDRAVTRESIEKFHLGFSPNQWDWILGRVKGDPARAKILETIGVLARPQDGGNYYDRFRGRLLFSIRDPQGLPVGIGGRVLPEGGTTSPAKYVNSPETPLFSKGKLLYGLDVAREAARRSGTVLVMEGYTDVIAAHQYGHDNAVAVLGTALGEGHIRVIKRFADRIVLVLDGDEAGQKRANEVLELFVAQQIDLRILTLPEGSDPCDFLQQHGAEAFGELLETQAIDALEHAFRAKTRGVDLQRDVHAASRSLEELVSIVAKAPRLRQDTTREDRLREEKILQRLAARVRIDEQEVRNRITALRRRQRTRGPMNRPEETPDASTESYRAEKIDPVYRELLELLISRPELLASVRGRVDLGQAAGGAARAVYETMCRLADEGIEPKFDRLMLQFDNPAVKSLLVELDEAAQAKHGADVDPEAVLEELIQTFKQKEAQRRRPEQLVALREGRLDDSQQTELLEKIIRQERNRQGISEPTDG